MINDEAGTPSQIPGSRLSSVIEQISGALRRPMGNALGEQVRGWDGSLIETVLCKQRDAGIAPGEGLGIEDGFGVVTVLRLRTNILEQ